MDEFGKSLSQLILRTSIAEPAFAEEYLKRVIAWERIREGTFEEIVAFSPLLAQSHARLLVELTLKHLIEELPDDRVARERAQLEVAAERIKQIRAKPESERNQPDMSSWRCLVISHFLDGSFRITIGTRFRSIR